MDMTLAEQQVWSAAYVQKQSEGPTNGEDPDDFLCRCAAFASVTVDRLRATFKYAAQSELVQKGRMGRMTFDYLRQMTFKADD